MTEWAWIIIVMVIAFIITCFIRYLRKINAKINPILMGIISFVCLIILSPILLVIAFIKGGYDIIMNGINNIPKDE